MKAYVLISGTALPGKFGDAGKAALATAQYLKDNSAYVGAYEILRPISGPNNQLYWLCRYQSMTDYERDMELRAKDPAWKEVFASVNQTVDVDNISSEAFKVLE